MALENKEKKRNATIRTEEDCYILSLDNEDYLSLLYEDNKGNFTSLSKYGFIGVLVETQRELTEEEKQKQLKEFVAEAICEILTSSNPRPLACEVKKIMKERYFELFKRQLQL